MRKLKYLSLFSGIGSPEMALRDLGIDYDLVGFSEVATSAIKAYCAIHNVTESANLGDITKIDVNELPQDIDLITHGSPCQDISVAGLKAGADEGSGTRSSLMWNTVDICRHVRPKYIVWENVASILHKSHVHNFNKYLNELSALGYVNYYQILNAKYFGVAQSRERMFVVSIRNDITQKFEFPKKYPYEVKLGDVLDKDVDARFFLKKILNPRKTKNYIQYDNSGKGHNSQTQRLYYMNGQMCTLPKCNSGSVTQVLVDEKNMIGRRITPCEAWRLMGFSDDDFIKASQSDQTLYSLYGLAGNSIVLPVMKEIFKNLLLL